MTVAPWIPKLLHAMWLDVMLGIQWRRDGGDLYSSGRTTCSDQGLVDRYLQSLSDAYDAAGRPSRGCSWFVFAYTVFDDVSMLFIKPVIMICYRPRGRK